MRIEENNGVCTIFLEGEIDAQNAGEVGKELDGLLVSHREDTLVFDAKDLRYISSAGLRLIIGAQKQARKKISVINISPYILEIFQIAGLQKIMEIRGI